MGALEMLSERLNIRIIWNFSATSYGKGPADGMGATLKRTAAGKVKQHKTVINNLHEFYEAVKHSTINVTCLSPDVLHNHVENLGLQKLFETANKIPDITKYHHIELKD